MALYPYLIAIALFEQKGKRSMPLAGKSLKASLDSDLCPGDFGETLIRDLLIRVFQRTELAALRRAAGDWSLLLIQIQMEVMQEHLPTLKSEWIESGDTSKFFCSLNELCSGVWSVTFLKHEGVQYKRMDGDLSTSNYS